MARKIRMGMIGGGRGAFIGAVHRMAAALDGEIELVCGAFSSDPETSKLSGADLYLDGNRVYASYEEMIKVEKDLPADKRMDLVSIVTPNHLHFAPAKLALENGFHVICDKPMCFDLAQANDLLRIVEANNLLFALTYNYTGYPMVKQARQMILHNEIGEIRRATVSYTQGWLTTPLEKANQKQALWRTDPSKAGIAGALGDIGTHAYSLLEYFTGLEVTHVNAQVNNVVEGRLLDDDVNVLLRFNNDAAGILSATQIAAGEENDLTIKIYGDQGGLEWSQMNPNSLIVKSLNKPTQIYRTGGGDLYPATIENTRLPAGHPEGYIEAFANVYKNVAKCIQAGIEGNQVNPIHEDYPTVKDGWRGMQFIHKVVESGNSDIKWTSL